MHGCIHLELGCVRHVPGTAIKAAYGHLTEVSAAARTPNRTFARYVPQFLLAGLLGNAWQAVRTTDHATLDETASMTPKIAGSQL